MAKTCSHGEVEVHVGKGARCRKCGQCASFDEPALDVAAFDRIIAEHTPGVETDSDYDFGSMWMTCSCGWDQNRDRVRNDYVSWEDHVRAALKQEAR